MEFESNLALNALVLVLATLGLAHLVLLAVRGIHELYRSFLRGSYNITKRYGGKWAVVTGATDGIGKAVAAEFAKRGLNVLLVSRTQSKLDETKEEIAGKFPQVTIKTHCLDFGNFGPSEQDQMKEVLQQLDADGGLVMLVNNVGISYDFPVFFHELSEDRVRMLIKLNVEVLTEMTRIALPIMKARTGAYRKGSIINIGSSSGLCSMPLLAEYSATKAYVQRLTEGLAVEYDAEGIDFQVHTPFYVVSKLSKFRKASIMVPSAAGYAKLLCNRIGYETVVQPHIGHMLTEFALNCAPAQLRDSYLYSMHAAIRKKALAKQKKAAEEKNQ